ncbi:hypothetical protein JAAARDRAFT_187693 [Jaapia argillacea MUCL 33604]|uniref:F-box domain-containing protein n=1 Tax=Jaapia argillacea MUCL 33604 TaxID=933084 RepID=A0A067QNY9_9AGAM|nr:hypothetical protein JAAARDRAFT_187693 [Jaapia argillacea MUCL 33604]
MAITFQSLPVELIADILSELDLHSLILVAYLSRRLQQIASDSALNPWRRPVLRNLHSGIYETCLKHLSVRLIVPRQNWVEILSMARASFLLFDATLPNLKDAEWEECFRRRFLPGWIKWKKESSWKETFINHCSRMLHRVWHRSVTPCTADESWTKYIVLNRNGSANEMDASSRNFNPLAIFNEMKLQSNLSHLETHIRLVVQFADIRVIALGVLNKPRGPFSINLNARAFLHPPGIEDTTRPAVANPEVSSSGSSTRTVDTTSPATEFSQSPLNPQYWPLVHPLPAPSHSLYPFFTPGGSDKRWIGSGPLEEGGLDWVGGLMLTAQVVGPHTNETFADSPPLQDLDLVVGLGRNQYASFTWPDLHAIAPWMEERITKKIDGAGLGN